MENLLEAGRQYQHSAVLLAAAELDLFAHAKGGASLTELAGKTGSDPNALRVLLDALASMKLLLKTRNSYRLAQGLDAFLTSGGRRPVLGMLCHQANCYRSWGELARVAKKGVPAPRRPSIRGGQGDVKSFIEAMHNVSTPVAAKVIRGVHPLSFTRLLDIGGASGTWTIAFLRACKSSRAVLLDLPQVIPLARKRLASEDLLDRVELASGDYNRDRLPSGCDLAWVSAIIHQNSMEQNLELFRRTHAALSPGGRIAIRDIVMEKNKVRPEAGALFAVNMLVNTKGGGTYTFNETKTALEKAGFVRVRLARRDSGMNAIIIAERD